MDIVNDQIELVNKNIKFLESYLSNLFNSLYNELEITYSNNIRASVIDEFNFIEVKEYLTTQFKQLENERSHPWDTKYISFNSIKIENKNFIYSFEELLKPLIDNQLIYSIYPVLEQKGFTDERGIYWKKSFLNTAKKVFIKYYINNFKELKVNAGDNRQPKYPDIFLNAESEDFFYFCLEKWLNNYKSPINAISYIFCRMNVNDLLNKYDRNEVLYSISKICKKSDFAKFWNDPKKVNHKFNYKIKPGINGGFTMKSYTECNSTPNINKFENILTQFNRKN